MITTALFSSASCEWETPQDTFNKLNKEFGFTLDPCATAQNAKCPQFFTREQDGLAQNWGGGESVLQSTIRAYNIRMGGKVLQGEPQARYDVRDVNPRKN